MGSQDKSKSELVFVRFDDLFIKYSNLYNIPYRWLKAISLQESSLGENERVKRGEVSYDGLSYGLMQIAEGVGSPKEIELKGFGGREALNNPEYSIEKASKLLGYLNKKYVGDTRKIFLAYNQGERNTDNNKDYTDQYDTRIDNWLTHISEKENEYGIFT